MDARSIEILTSSFWPILKAGISFTIPLTLISFALGTTLAVFVAIIRISKVPVLNKICELYVWIIRGTPLLVQLFLVFFGLPKVGVVINPMPSGIWIISTSASREALYRVVASWHTPPPILSTTWPFS